MADRALCQLALSFLLGTAFACTGSLWLLAMWGILILCISIMIWAVKKEQKNTSVTARLLLCLCFFLLGCGRCLKQQPGFREAWAVLLDGSEICVSGNIYKKETKYQQHIYYLKDAWRYDNNTKIPCSALLVYLDSDDYPIGATLKVKGTVKLFRQAVNEGNFDEKQYYYSRQIAFAVKDGSVSKAWGKADLLLNSLNELKQKMKGVYRELLNEKEAGLLSVMALGEKDMLDEQSRQLYRDSGISHVLAISGLHISILGAGLYGLLKKLRAGRFLSCLPACLLVYGFGRLAGMEVSSKRAVVMFFILMGSRLCGRAYDLLTALALAMLLQLWENPFSVYNAGFLFSYGAVLSVAAAGTMRAFLGRGKRKRGGKVLDTLWMSGCIQLMTLPMSLYFYYEFPVYGVFINALVLPLMGGVLSLGLAGGLLGLFHRRLAALVLRPVCLILSWNEGVCTFMGKLPGAVYLAGRPSLWLLGTYYGMIGLILIFMQRELRRQIRTGTKELPGRRIDNRENTDAGGLVAAKMEGIKTGRKLFVLVVLGAGLFGLILLRPGPRFQMAFLDVGQGDACFIESPEGRHFFVDGGSSDVSKAGEYRILPFLKSRGIKAIDGWFVSHGDADHISGLQELWMANYPIKTLLLAENMVRDEAWEALAEQAESHGTKVEYLKAGQQAGTKNLTFTCLYPWEAGTDRNGASMVLLLEQAGYAALFTGDISEVQERELVQNGRLRQVQLYKAAHHGSKTSNSQAFLKALSPAVTVVSCAKKNSYGHPAPEAVERIAGSGSRILYTMDSGQVTVGWHKGRIWVRRMLEDM